MNTMFQAMKDVEYEQPQQDAAASGSVCATKHAWARVPAEPGPAERAARAYKDINRLAFKLLEPGGVLFTYSCSGGISADLFHKIVASAGIDAGVDGFICERLQGAPDHPMTINFPEGEYLKGLVVVRK